MKYANKNNVSTSKKLSKKLKKSKRKKNDKKEKESKSQRRYSTSSSSSESCDGFEWVEKKTEDQLFSHTTESSLNSETPEKKLERDEWMNVESFLPCISKSDMQKSKSNVREENERKMLLDEPGQSNKELNPYWKNGGNGLPQSLDRLNNQSIMDANWLRKSLQRAEEQALRDGRSLEEVAAERWGSLEVIRTMIAKAERLSSGEQDKSYKRLFIDHSNRSDKVAMRTSSSKRRNRSRTRSRSRSRERAEKHNTLGRPSQHMRHKRAYQIPKDDSYYQQTAHRSADSSRVKNWKKDKDDYVNRESELSASQSKEICVKNNANETEKDKGSIVLSEAEMNKLGARIIKAEIMGDEELAAQLKAQLEEARKLITMNNTNAQKETVILTRTDAKGVTRPIQPRNQSTQSTERRKKKTAETHIFGERVRHFADDDKYSLHEMFQREKGRSANEDDAMFAKFASKSMDQMDEMFEQQIARTDSEAKQDKRERICAIKEHKDLSKFMDNCWWCLDSKNMLKHMVITMDSMICLSLPAYISLTTGHCILTPVQHIACQLQLDENVWERLKELKRDLTRMFTSENLYPVFFEVYRKRCRFSHMQLECIPLPKEIGESAPMYFKKALLECETEWSVNKKIVELKGKDIRRAVPNGLSYFMIEFASHPGYAHVIEDEQIFPKNFAEEIIGGMLDLDCNQWRKPKRQSFDDQRVKVLEFTKIWKKYNSSPSEDTP